MNFGKGKNGGTIAAKASSCTKCKIPAMKKKSAKNQQRPILNRVTD
jgi:hypothetical protein